MFNLIIDNVFYMVTKETISLIDLLKVLIPPMVKLKPKDQYDEETHSRGLALTLVDTKLFKTTAKLGLNAQPVLTKLRPDAQTIRFWSRFGTLVINTGKFHIEYDINTKVISIFNLETSMVMTNTVGKELLSIVESFVLAEEKKDPEVKKDIPETKPETPQAPAEPLAEKKPMKKTAKKAKAEEPKVKSETKAESPTIQIVSSKNLPNIQGNAPSLEEVFGETDLFNHTGAAE